MAGTKAGAQKTKAKILKRYGKDYYVKLGALGGIKGHTGGFYGNSARARRAGSKGGKVSKRRVKLQHVEDVQSDMWDEVLPIPVKQSWYKRLFKHEARQKDSV